MNYYYTGSWACWRGFDNFLGRVDSICTVRQVGLCQQCVQRGRGRQRQWNLKLKTVNCWWTVSVCKHDSSKWWYCRSNKTWLKKQQYIEEKYQKSGTDDHCLRMRSAHTRRGGDNLCSQISAKGLRCVDWAVSQMLYGGAPFVSKRFFPSKPQ